MKGSKKAQKEQKKWRGSLKKTLKQQQKSKQKNYFANGQKMQYWDFRAVVPGKRFICFIPQNNFPSKYDSEIKS